MAPCDKCGKDTPLHLLDGKPVRLGGVITNMDEWFTELQDAIDRNEDCELFECESCYGPGWAAADVTRSGPDRRDEFTNSNAVENQMPIYNVTLPIAGHACLQVEADDEGAAIAAAFEQVENKHIEDWEALAQFNSGNVCHCPSPWEAIAELDE